LRPCFFFAEGEDAEMVVRGACFAVMLALSAAGCSSFPSEPCADGPIPVVAVNDQQPYSTAVDAGTWIVNFGQVFVATEAIAKVVVNSDTCLPFYLLSVSSLSDPEFSMALPSGLPVEVGGSSPAAIFRLSFVPQSEGQRTTSVVLATDATSVPTITLVLEGTGVH
jgi:hypothetical protein